MPKSQKIVGNGQLNIFDIIEHLSGSSKTLHREGNLPGSFDIDTVIRAAISQSLKHAELDRVGVAAEMSRLLGRDVSKAMLDGWSAESKENHRFPAAFLNAFMAATGDNSILRLLCEKAGGHFIESEQALRLSCLNIREQKRELTRRERIIKEMLESLAGEKNEG